MTTQPTTQTPPQPKLQTLLDELDGLVQQLRHASEEYAGVKAIYQQVQQTGQLPEGCELSLIVPPGRALSIPGLADRNAILGALNGALGLGGAQVTALWRKIHNEVTGPAVQHCDAAEARAAAVANQNLIP